MLEDGFESALSAEEAVFHQGWDLAVLLYFPASQVDLLDLEFGDELGFAVMTHQLLVPFLHLKLHGGSVLISGSDQLD